MDPTPASPLLDGDLLVFSMKLPADYKLRRSRLRWFSMGRCGTSFCTRSSLSRRRIRAAVRRVGAAPCTAGGSFRGRPAWARGALGGAGRLRVRVDAATTAPPPGLLRRDGLDPDDAGAVVASACTELGSPSLTPWLGTWMRRLAMLESFLSPIPSRRIWSTLTVSVSRKCNAL